MALVSSRRPAPRGRRTSTRCDIAATTLLKLVGAGSQRCGPAPSSPRQWWCRRCRPRQVEPASTQAQRQTLVPGMGEGNRKRSPVAGRGAGGDRRGHSRTRRNSSPIRQSGQHRTSRCRRPARKPSTLALSGISVQRKVPPARSVEAGLLVAGAGAGSHRPEAQRRRPAAPLAPGALSPSVLSLPRRRPRSCRPRSCRARSCQAPCRRMPKSSVSSCFSLIRCEISLQLPHPSGSWFDLPAPARMQ